MDVHGIKMAMINNAEASNSKSKRIKHSITHTKFYTFQNT